MFILFFDAELNVKPASTTDSNLNSFEWEIRSVVHIVNHAVDFFLLRIAKDDTNLKKEDTDSASDSRGTD